MDFVCTVHLWMKPAEPKRIEAVCKILERRYLVEECEGRPKAHS